jgi:photosystem II stability/assembly factor-like uncharacterized protein
MGRGNGEALAVDPNNSDIIFFGSRDKGLFRSANNGTSWNKVTGFTAAAGSDTTWNGAGFSFVTFAPGSSDIMYAGFLRSDNNVFQSADGGTTWSVIPGRLKPATNTGYVPPLMPQRIVITPDGAALYITFGDGAGPHTMQWDEGWGPIDDWFNRGAVFKYETAGNGAWTDVSPEDFIISADNLNRPDQYIACYGGISINPTNPLEIVVSSLGYRGTQFWKVPGTANSWLDQWGSNIYYTNDGGVNWYPSFQYYWMEGGQFPPAEQMNENGIGWMFNSSIHWAGSVTIDPFDPKRVWVTSGNGIFRTDDITNFTYTPPENSWENPVFTQRTVWKVMSHGIEETVPYEVVSIPGGPLVSVILDYDGFRHDDIKQFPSTRHMTNISGSNVSLGNTRGLAYAHKSGTLVKATDSRRYVDEGRHMNVPHSPLQFSTDTARTWSVQTYQSGGPGDDYDGAMSLAISTDGQVAMMTPLSKWSEVTPGNWVEIGQPVWRYANSAWIQVTGIDGANIVGDPENADVFYAYDRRAGKFFKSEDKGLTFAEISEPGASGFYKFRLIPGKEGDIWLPLAENGLARSTDGGATWNKIPGVDYCEAVGFGKAAPESGYLTMFIFGTVGDFTGVFMSIDEGESWQRTNNRWHQYGGLANGEFVMGDMNVYGRVYMSTAGRGIVYGEIADTPLSIRGTARTPAAAGAVRMRGASIIINAAAPVSHQIRVFDLRGRQVYNRTVTGPATVSMSRVLPKGNYVVSVRRDGAGPDVYRGKMRIIR